MIWAMDKNSSRAVSLYTLNYHVNCDMNYDEYLRKIDTVLGLAETFLFYDTYYLYTESEKIQLFHNNVFRENLVFDVVD